MITSSVIANLVQPSRLDRIPRVQHEPDDRPRERVASSGTRPRSRLSKATHVHDPTRRAWPAGRLPQAGLTAPASLEGGGLSPFRTRHPQRLTARGYAARLCRDSLTQWPEAAASS